MDTKTATKTYPVTHTDEEWHRLLTPEPLVRKISDDLAKALSDPGVNQRLVGLGRFNRPMSPAEVTAFIHGEQRMWKPILEQTGSN